MWVIWAKNVGMVGELQKIKIWGWVGKNVEVGYGRGVKKNKNINLGEGCGLISNCEKNGGVGCGGGIYKPYKPTVYPKY